MPKRGMRLLAAGTLGLGACVVVSESESELVPGAAEAGAPDASVTDALTLPDADAAVLAEVIELGINHEQQHQ